jgi:hypothetical protein
MHLANDLVFWADAHAESTEEARELIKSAFDEALALLDAIAECFGDAG